MLIGINSTVELSLRIAVVPIDENSKHGEPVIRPVRAKYRNIEISMYGLSGPRHHVLLRSGLSYISDLMKKAAPPDFDLVTSGVRLSLLAPFYEFCSDIT